MSFLLPPGCRFYPSDEQLLRYYLTGKNSDSEDADNLIGYNLIKELDLYEYEPFDLPDRVCYAYGYGGRKRHWYCYMKVRVFKESRGGRRIAKGGYWRRGGKIRDVMGPGGNAVVGTKTKFVYYLGNSARAAVRTDWVLYEYALLDHVKASFVLCRVFIRSRGGHSISENVPSSCAEESISAVRRIGVQHDGLLTPDIVESKVCPEDSVDRRNDISRYPFRPSIRLNDQATTRPISAASLKIHSGIIPNKIVSSELTGGNILVHADTEGQLLSILEDDFIELDDLIN